MNDSNETKVNPEAQIHSHALIDEGARVGARTRVWAFAHILPGADIGEDCNICDHTYVEGTVILGDRVTVKCGVYLWDGITAEDDVFIGPAAVFTNDLKPRSRHYPEIQKTFLREGCSIGANATILSNLTVGAWSLVGAGSVVTKDVLDYSVVWGSPAQFRYWICKCTQIMNFEQSDTFICHCGQKYQFDSERQKVTCYE